MPKSRPTNSHHFRLPVLEMALVPAVDAGKIGYQMEKGNLAPLLALPRQGDKEEKHILLEVIACPQCGGQHYVNLCNVVFEMMDGERKRYQVHVVRLMCVSAGQVERLREFSCAAPEAAKAASADVAT